MNSVLKRVLLMTGILLGAQQAGWATETPQEEGYSEANTLLFLSDHLKDVQPPTVLRYDFKKGGTKEEGFTDTIELDVVKTEADGSKDVKVQYFTGERQEEFPPVQHARGNPILLVFLQRDVGEMERLTEGSWRYFQRSIKMAFADNAEVKPVVFRFRGQEVQGTQVKITPYTNDPMRPRFEEYANKYYTFTLSEAVPGWVYEMRAVTPQADGKGEALMEETVTLQGAERL